MTSARIVVLTPGLLTTIQDVGRAGYQNRGVPVGGAMDRVACLVANRLVGNDAGNAVLELTMKGPKLLFGRDAIVAITGGDLAPMVGGQGIPLWTAVAMTQDSVLEFGRRCSGARSYLAIASGIEVPAVLGSRATHLRTGMGGLAGRALVAGDELMGGPPSSGADRLVRPPLLTGCTTVIQLATSRSTHPRPAS